MKHIDCRHLRIDRKLILLGKGYQFWPDLTSTEKRFGPEGTTCLGPISRFRKIGTPPPQIEFLSAYLITRFLGVAYGNELTKSFTNFNDLLSFQHSSEVPTNKFLFIYWGVHNRKFCGFTGNLMILRCEFSRL